MRFVTAFCLSLCFSFSLFTVPAQVIILPSGEVDSSGNLTQQGLERAGALADYIILTPNFTSYGEPISIFAARPSSLPADNTQACIQTVSPTAQILNLPIHSGYSKLQDTGIASFILNDAKYSGKNILICWRPDSIQALAAAFGVSSPPNFPPNTFNVAWLITFSTGAALQILPQNLLLADNTVACGCGTVPYSSNTGYLTLEPTLDSSQVWSFVSEPSLQPMKVAVNLSLSGTAPGLILLAPYAFSFDSCIGQQGALIVDSDGNPVWFSPTGSSNLMNTDFRVQTLNGEPVLTFWQGTLATPPAYTNLPAASSEPGSCYHILDGTYATLQTVSAQNDFTSDIHEFLITPNNTALLLSTKPVAMDLTPYGGPQNGYVNDFAVQEIDLETNELLFFWDALENIPLTDSFEPASTATSSNNIWDAYHLNSIGLVTDGSNDIIVSSRNTWTIYRISRPSGNIVWQLGGKQSSFMFGSGAEFSWQHDARFLSNTATTDTVSLFDDNCCESETIPPGTPPAHGLELELDLTNMTASLSTSYYHDPNINVASQGNVQTLANTNKFIGWGQSQYYSEYLAAGNTESDPSLNLIYDVSFPANNYTYRAYKFDWVGTPSYPPSMAIVSDNGQLTVYASWNGSTETSSWQVFAGSSPTNLSMVASAMKSGFETAIPISSSGPYFQVQALDAGSHVLGVSSVMPFPAN